MKIKTALFVFVILSGQVSLSAGASRFVSAVSDRVTVSPSAEKDPLASEDSLLIDGDNTMGIADVRFNDNFRKKPTAANLIVNTSDHEYAESPHGFSVWLGDRKIGSSGKVERNAKVIISLNASALGDFSQITLTLKADGTDGTYIRSVKSGFGPVLELIY